MVVCFREDPDIVRDFVELEEQLEENAVDVYGEYFGACCTPVRPEFVSKSAECLAKMMAVIVTVFEAADFTESEKKTETMLLQRTHEAPRTSTLVIEAAGQRYRQTAQVLYMGGLIYESANIMPEIKRRVRLA